MDIEIPEIRSARFYLDEAFSQARDEVREMKESLSEIDDFDRKKRAETEKIEFIREYLNDRLKKVILGFPKFEDMSDFYVELMKASLDYDKLRECIEKCKEGLQEIREIGYYYSMRIESAETIERCDEVIEEYYAEVEEELEKIEDDLEYLKDVRQILLDFPSIKKGLFTVCLAGFPNVGKTSLLNDLTGEDGEVEDEELTTQSFNLGFFKENYQRIQVIDTPGTLARLNEGNMYEKQARLVIDNQADYIVYLFDLSENEYSLDEQHDLFEEVLDFDKDVMIYVTKIEDVDQGKIDDFKEKYAEHPIFEDVESIREELGTIAFDRVEF